MAHTPGPWTVDGPPHNQIVWSAPYSRVCFLAHSNGRDVERDIATGRLIAAAPDLLDALRRIMTYASDGAAVRDIDTSVQPEFVAARAAIAKAEGR